MTLFMKFSLLTTRRENLMDSLVVWSGVMIACIVVEILTVSLVSVWFVIGAFVAMIACLLNVSVPIQVGIFLVVSVICAIVALIIPL